MLKRFGVPIVACLALAGCKLTSPADPAQAVYALEGTLSASMQIATVYAQLPSCGAGAPAVCSDPATVTRMQVAAPAAVSAVQAAQVAVTTGGTSSAAIAADLAAAEAAVEALTAITGTVKTS